MNQSESIDELAKAMVKVQLGLPGAKKSADNPFYKKKYADLKDCLEAGREILSENGLCVIQTLGGTAEAPSVITTLMHESGQWIKGENAMTPDKKGPQAIGSCITYGRRYGYSAIIGLHQEDDDGEGATNRGKEANKSAKTNPADSNGNKPFKVVNEAQIKRFHAIKKDFEWSDTGAKSLLAKYEYTSTKEIEAWEDYGKIIKELQKGEDGKAKANAEGYCIFANGKEKAQGG